MIVSFIGDICLGRNVRKKFDANPYQLVSQDLIDRLVSQKGRVIANLESPIAPDATTSSFIGLSERFPRFSGTPSMLSQFNWVNCFSLANNHINDIGEEGMFSTIENIQLLGSDYCGLFHDEYLPYLIHDNENKIAVFTCADRINHIINPDSCYKLLRVYGDDILSCIEQYKQRGYFVIVYAHMGSMFCRVPNLPVLDIIHKMVDQGCDCLFVSHPHCIGGVYKYKDTPIFYSLGDFLMDGESFVRRQSYAVKLSIENNRIMGWELIPTIIDTDLSVRLLSPRKERRILRRIERISSAFAKQKNYRNFYKCHYRNDMLRHSLSTISFVFKTKGLLGGLNSLIVRKKDVQSMVTRVRSDRTDKRNG